MSPVHHSVLLYVVNFLRDAIKHSPSDCAEKRTLRIGKSIQRIHTEGIKHDG